MNESTATRYQRLRRSAQIVNLSVGAAWLVIVVVTPVGRWLADRAVTVADDWAALLFITTLVVGWEAVALPASVSAAVRGERRLRKGDAAVATQVRAHLREALTGVVVAVAGGVAMWSSFSAFGAWWWVALGSLGAPMLLLATAMAGVTVRASASPLPMAREGLAERLSLLAERACGRRVPVREWTDPASSAPTALVTGVGRSGAILLSRVMVAEWSDDEIAVVVAHELSHHARHDLWRKAALDAGALLVVLGLAHLVTARLGGVVGVRGFGDLLAVPLAGLTAWVAWWAVRPIRLAQSRAHERHADRCALALTGNPDAFRSALRRLATLHLAEERPSTLTRLFFHRHPTVDERLSAVVKR